MCTVLLHSLKPTKSARVQFNASPFPCRSCCWKEPGERGFIVPLSFLLSDGNKIQKIWCLYACVLYHSKQYKHKLNGHKAPYKKDIYGRKLKNGATGLSAPCATDHTKIPLHGKEEFENHIRMVSGVYIFIQTYTYTCRHITCLLMKWGKTPGHTFWRGFDWGEELRAMRYAQQWFYRKLN